MAKKRKRIQPGFDPGFFVDTAPEIGPDLQAVSETLTDLQVKIATALEADVNKVGQTIGGLTGKINGDLQDTLSRVRGTIGGLQYKIESNLAGEMGNAMEIASPYFVEPVEQPQVSQAGYAPAPNCEQPPPQIEPTRLPADYCAVGGIPHFEGSPNHPPAAGESGLVQWGNYFPAGHFDYWPWLFMFTQGAYNRIIALTLGVNLCDREPYRKYAADYALGVLQQYLASCKLADETGTQRPQPPSGPPTMPLPPTGPPQAPIPPQGPGQPPPKPPIPLGPVPSMPIPPKPIPPPPTMPLPGPVPKPAPQPQPPQPPPPQPQPPIPPQPQPGGPTPEQIAANPCPPGKIPVYSPLGFDIVACVTPGTCVAGVPYFNEALGYPAPVPFPQTCGPDQPGGPLPGPLPTPIPQPLPPPPKPDDKCPLCACVHDPCKPCPSGTVKHNGCCVSPAEVEASKKKRYEAYCLPQSESAVVNDSQSFPPPSGGILVGIGDTPQEALVMAAGKCQPKIAPVSLPPVSPRPFPSGSSSPLCDPNIYGSSGFNVYDFVGGFSAVTTGALASIQETVSRELNASNNPVFQSLVGGAAILSRSTLAGFQKAVELVAREGSKLGGCTDANFQAAFLGKTVMEAIDKYIGGPWGYLGLPLDYQMQKTCPIIMPTTSQALQQYLGGYIDINRLRHFAEINGQCWEPYAPSVIASASKPIPGELIQLVLRKTITESEYQARMRELGYVRSSDVALLRSLGVFVPPYTDLTRFMVRDVEDENIITKFELDTDFTKKYTGRVKEWSEAQGITDDVMRRIWRAHWQIPSPTQLFEMYHRLSRLPEGDKNRLTMDDIRDALIYQDINPFWIPKFLAISHKRLRLVDIRRAFEIGAIGRDRVKEFYRELGYTEDNAELLTKYAEKQKLKLGMKHPSVMLYVNGTLGTAELIADLLSDGFDNETATKISERAIKKFRVKWQSKCIAGIRKRLLSTELTKDKAEAELVGRGFDGLQASIMADAWQCELLASGREFTASQLCHYFEVGLLDAVEFVERLQRLGYRKIDAQRIAADCARSFNIKLGKDAQKRAAKDAADLAKLQANQERAAKQQEQREKAAKKLHEQACSAKNRRDKAMLVAADKYAKAAGIDVALAFDILLAEYTRVRAAHGLTADEGTQAVVLAAEKWTPDRAESIQDLIEKFATGFQELDPSNACQDESGPFTRNGSSQP